MNKIRQAKPVIDVPTEKRSVPELHIDADEDHVALQDKRKKGSAIVPLVSAYEGVEDSVCAHAELFSTLRCHFRLGALL